MSAEPAIEPPCEALPCYIADSVDLVRKVELDGLTALYHLPSGTTHILAPPAPQILDALAGSGADVAELVRRMAELFELDSEDNITSMQARLVELEAAGLVRRL